MNRNLLGALALSSLTFLASNAWAGTATRAWVSGHGTDASGCGAPANPCRSLQYTEDNIIAADGEIDILDPAGYGSVIISKALSIVNDGVGTAGVQQSASNGTAITISAGTTDAVTLRGLSIDGLGVAYNGIDEIEAGKLTITNCVIRHFAHDGVIIEQDGAGEGFGILTMTVTGTTSADNVANGFDITPTAHGQVYGVVDHDYAVNNGQNGVVVWGLNTSLASNAVFVTVANTDVSNNGNDGIYVKGSVNSNTRVMVSNDIADYDSWGYYGDVGSYMIYTKSEALNDTNDSVFAGNPFAWTMQDNAFWLIDGTLTPKTLK